MHIITPTNQTHQTTFNTTTRDKHDSMHVIPHPKTIQKKKNKSTDPSSHNKPFPIESIRKAPKLARKAQIGKLNHQKKKKEPSFGKEAIPDPAPRIGDGRRRWSRTQQWRPWPANQRAAEEEEETASVEWEGRACRILYTPPRFGASNVSKSNTGFVFSVMTLHFYLSFFRVLPVLILFVLFSLPNRSLVKTSREVINEINYNNLFLKFLF